MVLLLMRSDAVEMIKQFPEPKYFTTLAIHGDVVYIGSYRCVIEWKVVTSSVVRLDGYSNGFILQQICFVCL
jgi:hypothetical protein